MPSDAKETSRITLLDSLSQELLQLPYAAMREVGPAVQTLAGLIRVTKKETFAPIQTIADRARLPLKTVRNHLSQLHDAGWIVNTGRGHTRMGLPRRTCTIRVAQKTIDALPTYGLLPWWATAKFPNVRRKNARCKNLPWGTRALLSVIMAKLAAMKSAIEPGIGKGEIDTDEFWLQLGNFGDENHFLFSLRNLQQLTGLSKHAIIDAKHSLHRWGFVEHRGRKRDDGGDDTDLLFPSERFVVLHTPVEPGRCYLNIERKQAS